MAINFLTFTLKWTVSRDEYFLKALKIKTVSFDCWWFVYNFSLSFWEENPNKVSACCFKNHLWKPSCNPLQGACSGFPIAAWVWLYKSCSKAACDTENCPKSRPWMYTGENGAIREQRKPEQKFDAAFGTMFRISVFKALKKKHLRMYRKGRFNSLGLLVHSTLL